MSLPSKRIDPLVGSIIRLIMRSEVVLPHPEGPTKTVMRPASTTRSRLSTATVPSGYFLVTALNSITTPRLLRSRRPLVRPQVRTTIACTTDNGRASHDLAPAPGVTRVAHSVQCDRIVT